MFSQGGGPAISGALAQGLNTLPLLSTFLTVLAQFPLSSKWLPSHCKEWSCQQLPAPIDPLHHLREVPSSYTWTTYLVGVGCSDQLRSSGVPDHFINHGQEGKGATQRGPWGSLVPFMIPS